MERRHRIQLLLLLCLAIAGVTMTFGIGAGSGAPSASPGAANVRVQYSGLNQLCPGFTTPVFWNGENVVSTSRAPGLTGPIDLLVATALESHTEYTDVPGALERYMSRYPVWTHPAYATVTWTTLRAEGADGAGIRFGLSAHLARIANWPNLHFVGVGMLKVTRDDQAKVISQDGEAYAGSAVMGMAVGAGDGRCVGLPNKTQRSTSN